MRGFMFGILLTIFVVGGGGFYLYETKFKEEPQAAGPAIVIQTAPAAQTSASPEPTPAPTAQPAAAPTSSPALAHSDHESVAGMNLVVTELKRTSGDTITLKFMIHNAGTTTDYVMNRQHDIELVDAVNKKKYLVIKDADGNCLCTPGGADVKPGSQVSIWAKFPAPPAEVTKVSVAIPGFISMDDVPVSP